MKKSYSREHGWRFFFVIVVLCCVGIGILFRVTQLMLLQKQFLKRQGDARALRTVTLSAHRGTIYDRHGEPLAISIPVYSLAANPQQLAVDDTRLAILAHYLDLDLEQLKARIKRYAHKEFIYIKRMINPKAAKKITALQLKGLILQPEYRRFYPSGEVAVHVVGLTNIDDEGQEGIELEFEKWLAGVPGKKRVIKDRLGHVVEDLDVIRKAKHGRDLYLSIDKRLQYAAYHELKKAIHKYEAKSGSVVLLDVKTGEVLAMVNQPSFNPNDRPRPYSGEYRNRAVTDIFEPGSVIKPFTVALALHSGKFKPESLIDTSPGWFYADSNRVSDPHNLGIIDVTTILQKSSNVGIAKLALALPPESLWSLFNAIGFGVRTGSGFPGESPGKLVRRHRWHPFTIATLSFGYGMSVTALQLAQAYAMLAEDGVKHAISFTKLASDQTIASQRIIAPKVADAVLSMLEKVIERGGTGTRAQVPGYRITGKTGTVRLVGPNGYLRGHHIAIFAGIAPASAPRVATVIVLNDPQAGAYYGGVIAAPVYSKVMARALRIMDIAPDNVKSRRRENE